MFSMIRTIGRRSIPLVAALATLVTAACGGDGEDSTGPGPTTSEATVTVVNHAPTGTVLFLRYRACGSSQCRMGMIRDAVFSEANALVEKDQITRLQTSAGHQNLSRRILGDPRSAGGRVCHSAFGSAPHYSSR